MNYDLEACGNHLFNGITADRERGPTEIFTPRELVDQILDNMDLNAFRDASLKFLDNACGNGNFLAAILYRRLSNGLDLEQSLKTLYGIDIMADNVELCRNRLLCGYEQYRPIVNNNIVCANALKYHYRFDGTPADSMGALFDE